MNVCELKDMLENYGDKMTQDEINEFLTTADRQGDGMVNYLGNDKYMLQNCHLDK